MTTPHDVSHPATFYEVRLPPPESMAENLKVIDALDSYYNIIPRCCY